MDRHLLSDYKIGSIDNNIIRLTIPLVIAELVNVLYGVVDRVFIGHIGGIGTEAISSIGITLPIITLISAFAGLSSIGAGPIFSIYRGKGDAKQASVVLETAVTMLLLLGVVLTIIVISFTPQLLMKLGATEETLPHAIKYLRIYALGIVCQLFALGGTPLLSAQGLSKTSSFAVIIGALLNTFLDAFFVIFLGKGVAGAALASVISQAATASVIITWLCSDRVSVKIQRLRFDGKLAKEIVTLGLSGFTFKATNSFVQMISNITLLTWGGAASTLYIGSMSIISAVREVVIQPVQSFAYGAIPVTSYNYGAGEHERVKKSISFVTKLCLGFELGAWVIIQLFATQIVKLFTVDNLLIQTCVPCLRIFFAALFCSAFQMSGQSTFVALNMPKHALFFSLLRKVILIAPLTVLLPYTCLGVMGVFIAESISLMTGSVFCYITMRLSVWEKL